MNCHLDSQPKVTMNCRFDNNPLSEVFIDLGSSPASNSFLTQDQLNESESYYPLKLYVSETSFLVQIDEYKKAGQIFGNNYAYFSSISKSWLRHAKLYADKVQERFDLNENHQVVEIASNDGYLLQYFKEKNIPVLGIEPSSNVAEAAMSKGIDTITEFFGQELARRLRKEGISADLLIGNNVLAHVPDLNDFVSGMKILLNPEGVITMEFPHLMKLIDEVQFDTIYHEHFSYFSLYTAILVFKKHGLTIFDVEELNTHGGSLRIYARHEEDLSKSITANVDNLLKDEIEKGVNEIKFYKGLQDKVNHVKNRFLSFLIEQKFSGKSVVGYGAAAKGNTFINYCGIKQDLIKFVVDASPYKQGKYLPGSHIPVVAEDAIRKEKPDFIVIFPWNIKEEIMDQLSYVREWGCQFVVAIPSLILI